MGNELSNICGYSEVGGWDRVGCQEQKPCDKHDNLKCVSCGSKATHGCEEAMHFVCGFPLCDNCEHYYDDVNKRNSHRSKEATTSVGIEVLDVSGNKEISAEEFDDKMAKIKAEVFLNQYPLTPEEAFSLEIEKETFFGKSKLKERAHGISKADELECLIKNKFYKFPHIKIDVSISRMHSLSLNLESNVVLERDGVLYLVWIKDIIQTPAESIGVAHKRFVDQCLNITKNYIVDDLTVKYSEVYKQPFAKAEIKKSRKRNTIMSEEIVDYGENKNEEKPFETRLKNEYSDLKSRTDTLSEYVTSNHFNNVLTDFHQDLLEEQLATMKKYCRILSQRMRDLHIAKDYVEAVETVGAAEPTSSSILESGNKNLTMGAAIDALQRRLRVRRACWPKHMKFIFMQVPSTVNNQIVPKMTSLPETVKEYFAETFQSEGEQIDAIYYQDQIAMVHDSNLIVAWSPSVSDLLCNDWVILD